MLTKKMPIKLLASLLLIVLNCLPAQSQSKCRYHDTIFFDTVGVDAVYARYVNSPGDTVDLKMHIYQPDGDIDTNRPAIILIHGGGFIIGNYDDHRVLEMCRRFTIRGYVTASIDYRLYTEDTVPPEAVAAVNYKSTQDAKAAIRFIRAHAAAYGVNPKKIFLHGFSSGAFMGNHAAYWDYDEVADSLKAAYGDFEAGGNSGVADTVSGVMGWAGAIMDTTWLNNEPVAWGSVHDTLDTFVNYWDSIGNYYGSGSINQYRENHFLSSSLLTVNLGVHTPDTGTHEYNIFSDYSIDFFYDLLQTGCIVPVLLSDFKAESVNGSLLLKWTTLSEINSSHFNVERSKDGINFSAIGRVNAAGNSNLINQYSFKDKSPIKGKSYYRLQEVDKDNRTMYSKIVSVNFNSTSLMALTANPVKDKLFIQLQHLPPADAAWRMYNMNGQIIYHEKLSTAVIEKNIGPLSPGIYMVEIIISGRTERIKILKQ